ncbi:hypothetical protein OBBRIDRAFT_814321 [Obba rivulosa]|uniref:Uncharacterized protein n=1 Tax=Obba rivulosa TaxID=1052685 RepID=A0A8E2ALZ3_9APHY|nr:hypothetical protein OBBRIDRAFT_814321 [Obba rivulosa]
MCPNFCMAYTGPYSGLDTCLYCCTPQYFLSSSPIRANKSHSDNSWCHNCRHSIALLRNATSALLQELEQNTGQGSDYLDAVRRGDVQDDDVYLMLSLDSAQLYASKQSDCWVYIWVIINLSPDKQYKKKYILSSSIISGPNKPKNIDSFLFLGIYHLSTIMCDGLSIWDAHNNCKRECHLYCKCLSCNKPSTGQNYLVAK